MKKNLKKEKFSNKSDMFWKNLKTRVVESKESHVEPRRSGAFSMKKLTVATALLIAGLVGVIGCPPPTPTGGPYSCPNGVAEAGEAPVAGTIKCTQCISGFDIINEQCVDPNSINRFVCPNGTADATEAPIANAVKCTGCNSGYNLENERCVVETFDYVCPNGTANSGEATIRDTVRCTGCNSGYNLENNQCVPPTYNFVCPNGTPSGATTNVQNRVFCIACDRGRGSVSNPEFSLQGGRCEQRLMSTCPNGAATAGFIDTPRVSCGLCNLGYFLDGSTCRASGTAFTANTVAGSSNAVTTVHYGGGRFTIMRQDRDGADNPFTTRHDLTKGATSTSRDGLTWGSFRSTLFLGRCISLARNRSDYYLMACTNGRIGGRQALGTVALVDHYNQNHISFTGITYSISANLFVAVGFHFSNFNSVILTRSGSSPIPVGANHWSRRSTGSTSSLTGISVNGTRFVAVGASGTILTSTGGTSWVKRDAGTSNTLRGVAYGNGVFVAVGDSGVVVRSTNNGVTWTQVSNSISGTLRGVAYGNGVFVAVGRGIFTSANNGLSWRGVGVDLITHYAVAYGKGRFVAVADAGRVSTSR